MARRSSRLSARKSSTPQPQRVSEFAYDDAVNVPRTMPRLASLNESDEMPGAFPKDSPATDELFEHNTPTKLAAHIADAVAGGYRTPKHATPIKPSEAEMHPKQYQASTAKPLEEARWLGFSSMAPRTEPSRGADKCVPVATTPSKTPKAGSAARPSEYEFTFRAQSLELSDEARQMMAEKRVEAAKIKEQLLKDEQVQKKNDAARKVATAKGKVGRFSDVHMAQFKKMDSIADHAAASRLTQPTTTQPLYPSLKRTSSKAGLAQGGRGGPKLSDEESASKTKISQLPRSNSVKSIHRPAENDSSPAKRVRRVIEDDAGTARPTSSSSDKAMQSTPKKLYLYGTKPQIAGAATPTASSLARQSIVKANKSSMIPSLTRSPSKSALKSTVSEQSKQATPLLSRSPSKGFMPFVKQMVSEIEAPGAPESPLLSRSPSKPILRVNDSVKDQDDSVDSTRIPFLARSPSKMSITKHSEPEEKTSKTPLLSRSPSKATKHANPFTTEGTPAKSGETTLMDRLKLLRASPVKSILRSPQRLYSNDKSKIASGTHVATPEKMPAERPKLWMAQCPQTEPIRKHVDFTASTKGLNEPDTSPQTPTKEITPPLREIKTVEQAKLFYPPLPSEHDDKPASVKKFNRRMTLGANTPGDFTFRSGAGITFAPTTNSNFANLKSSIRHVSAEPELASTSESRKRKFSLSTTDEPQVSKRADHSSVSSDKENDDHSDREQDPRPLKRVKKSETESRPAAAPKVTVTQQQAKRLPTLGVKPKNAPKPAAKPKDKRPGGGGMLSQARLNMLAMPKRRPGE